MNIDNVDLTPLTIEEYRKLRDLIRESAGKYYIHYPISLQHIPLTQAQVSHVMPLENKARKQYILNQPCICDSKRKLKRCCWYKLREIRYGATI